MLKGKNYWHCKHNSTFISSWLGLYLFIRIQIDSNLFIVYLVCENIIFLFYSLSIIKSYYTDYIWLSKPYPIIKLTKIVLVNYFFRNKIKFIHRFRTLIQDSTHLIAWIFPSYFWLRLPIISFQISTCLQAIFMTASWNLLISVNSFCWKTSGSVNCLVSPRRKTSKDLEFVFFIPVWAIEASFSG